MGTEEELGGQVANRSGPCLGISSAGPNPPVEQAVPDGVGKGHVVVIAGGHLGETPDYGEEVVQKASLECSYTGTGSDALPRLNCLRVRLPRSHSSPQTDTWACRLGRCGLECWLFFLRLRAPGCGKARASRATGRVLLPQPESAGYLSSLA